MPKIHAATNAEQRALTKRAILDSFGSLLYEQGLTGLTMTHVARNAGIGRTAVYNYFADMGELLIAYTMDETSRFMTELQEQLSRVENPVDQLGVYVRAQLDDLSRRHIPPGPTMRTVLAPEDFQKLGAHVGALRSMLTDIIREAIAQRWLPEGDIEEMARLVHGSLASTADRDTQSAEDRAAHEHHIQATVTFILRGLGARFDADGSPARLSDEQAGSSTPSALGLAS